MSIQKQVQFIAHEHAERVILTDSFGKVHELKINLLATPDPDAVIAEAMLRMEQDEDRVRAIAEQRGHRHPALEAGEPENCKDCG